jgi:riboflavin biosynthesis pyrimidine reductase
MTARIDRLWPDPAEHLTDDQIVEPLVGPAGAGVRVNFVSSIDGAATRDGLSGGLGDASDRRRFELLRRVCDVVLVGAGTVRAEGYGPMRVSDASARWRAAQGMPPHPVFAIVSNRLDLDPSSRTFTQAPARPIVVTTTLPTADEQPGLRERLAEVADLVTAGERHVDLAAALAQLRDRGTGGYGFSRILCEGGPTLFGTALAADVVDELCITIAPTLEAGDARRIARGETPPRGMRLVEVLRSGETLLLRYRSATDG